jgi:hypothetical protein
MGSILEHPQVMHRRRLQFTDGDPCTAATIEWNPQNPFPSSVSYTPGSAAKVYELDPFQFVKTDPDMFCGVPDITFDINGSPMQETDPIFSY